MPEKINYNNFPILVVEDDPATQLLLTKTLLKEGYEVVSASDGGEALSLFQDFRFRIVLTDWMMPQMTGVELCREIRKSDGEGYVFVILLTAKDRKEDVIQGLMAGADDYLTKPLNHAELLARLNTGKRILSLEKSLREAIAEIEVLSVTDPLTGCFNREYLMKNLPNEIKRSARYERPFSIVFCDLDHFKKVNDKYGHQVGDRTLIEFVQVVMGSIRLDLDWFTRYGGEEFLLVLPETDAEGAMTLTQRLLEMVREIDIKIHNDVLKITSSFGIVTYDPNRSDKEMNSEELIRLADKFLYQSKKEGRDRITSGILP